ncbi:ABC transporter permease, partial [Mycobacteroides chelonae]|uniref:ABC transporter permease n=2 Tax=Mycobacteriaceae TaxID=1762 RepID=UPI0013F4E4FE
MTASRHIPGPLRPFQRAQDVGAGPIMQLGHMLTFFGEALAGIPFALRHYRREFVRLLSDISWGNGSIVVGGGTAGVAVGLGMLAGALIAIEGYAFLDLLGLGPATGFISSLVNTRELAPLMASLAFAVQA